MVMTGPVLILGGTAEARELASLLVETGTDVVSSLAGAVPSPALPPGQVRLGGFGGPEGLAAYVRERGVPAVVDATHPFAARMTTNAARGAELTGVPLLRLQRPGWGGLPGAARWHWVDSVAEAVAVAERLGERSFVTTGVKTLPAYASWTDRYVLARMVTPPGWQVPPAWEILLARGPFDLNHETTLLRERRIDVLTTKDSGGSSAEAKLHAADDLGVAVVVVRRPPLPDGVAVVRSAGEAARWVQAQVRLGSG